MPSSSFQYTFARTNSKRKELLKRRERGRDLARVGTLFFEQRFQVMMTSHSRRRARAESTENGNDAENSERNVNQKQLWRRSARTQDVSKYGGLQ